MINQFEIYLTGQLWGCATFLLSVWFIHPIELIINYSTFEPFSFYSLHAMYPLHARFSSVKQFESRSGLIKNLLLWLRLINCLTSKKVNTPSCVTDIMLLSNTLLYDVY